MNARESDEIVALKDREALLIYCEAIISATVELQKNLGRNPFKPAFTQQPQKQQGNIETWDSSKINWKQGVGPKGPMEISEDQTNVEHQKMLKLVEMGGGRLWNRKEPDGSRWNLWSNSEGVVFRRRKEAGAQHE